MNFDDNVIHAQGMRVLTMQELLNVAGGAKKKAKKKKKESPADDAASIDAYQQQKKDCDASGGVGC